MSFNIIKTDSNNIDTYDLQNILYCEDSKDIYYCSKENELIKLDCGIFIDEKSTLDDIQLPIYNRIYIVYKENKLYKYTEQSKFSQITTENEILSIICKYDEYVISTLSNHNNIGIAPITSAINTLSDIDAKDAEGIIDDIDKKVYRYRHDIRYVDILEDNQNLYTIPYPIPNFDIETGSIIIMYNNKVLNPVDDYTTDEKYITDNNYIVHDDCILITDDAISKYNFKQGTQLIFIFGYYRLIGLNNISKSDLTTDLIDELKLYENHIINKDNPHEVTKEQIGLSNVANYPPATIEEAKKGTSNEHYMTPSTTINLIDELKSNAQVQYESYIISQFTHIYKADSNISHDQYSSIVNGKNITHGAHYSIPSSRHIYNSDGSVDIIGSEDGFDSSTDILELFIHGLKLKKNEDYMLDFSVSSTGIPNARIVLLIDLDKDEEISNIVTKIKPNENSRTVLKARSYWYKAEIESDNHTFILDASYNNNCELEIYKNGVRLIQDISINKDDPSTDYTLGTLTVTLKNPVSSNDIIYYYIYNNQPTYADFNTVKDDLDTSITESGDKFALSANMGNRLKQITMDYDIDYLMNRRPGTLIEYKYYDESTDIVSCSLINEATVPRIYTMQNNVYYFLRKAHIGEYDIIVRDYNNQNNIIATIARRRVDNYIILKNNINIEAKFKTIISCSDELGYLNLVNLRNHTGEMITSLEERQFSAVITRTEYSNMIYDRFLKEMTENNNPGIYYYRLIPNDVQNYK